MDVKTSTKTSSTKRPAQTAASGTGMALSAAEVIAQLTKRHKPKQHRLAWDEARPFVMNAVTTTALASNRDASKLMRIAAPFVMWCVEEHGLELRDELIFAPTLIDRYCTTAFTREGTGGTYRSVLLAISASVLPNSRPKLTAMHKRKIQAPYTTAEMEAHALWAAGQKTALSRHRCMLLVAFTAGAGLQPGELRTLRRTDVTIDEDGVLVRVRGRNARSVPMLREWEEWAQLLVNGYPEAELLWGGPRAPSGNNMVSDFMYRTMGVVPALTRLRATWTTTHLGMGTPIKELLRAGGMAQFENLNQYLTYVEAAPMAEYRMTLRGAEGP
ncbi:site-specific integrase [Salinibacterium sp. M195]|nr:site-specific integrase [Salinibacterium sp. M195]